MKRTLAIICLQLILLCAVPGVASARDSAPSAPCVGITNVGDVPVHTQTGGSGNVHFELSSNPSGQPCALTYILRITSTLPWQNAHFHIRVWVCGQRRPDLDQDYQAGAESPNGGQLTTRSAPYPAGCNGQADDLGSYAYNGGWDVPPTKSAGPHRAFAYIKIG